MADQVTGVETDRIEVYTISHQAIYLPSTTPTVPSLIARSMTPG